MLKLGLLSMYLKKMPIFRQSPEMRILSTLPFQWLNHKKALIGQRLSLLRHALGRGSGGKEHPGVAFRY